MEKIVKNRFFRKILIWPKIDCLGQKWWFFSSLKNFVINFFGENVKYNISLLIFHHKPPYLTEVWFSSYGSKCFWSIRLHYFIKYDISRKIREIKLIFCKQIRSIKVYYKLIVLFWWVCPGISKVPKVIRLLYHIWKFSIPTVRRIQFFSISACELLVWIGQLDLILFNADCVSKQTWWFKII